MLKRKALAGVGSGQTSGKNIPLSSSPGNFAKEAEHSEDGSMAKQLALVMLWFLLGLIMPRASVYGGLAPFGVSFAAAVPGAGAVGAYIASLIGYLLPGGVVTPLRYIAALVAVAGIKWSLSGIKAAARHPLFAPIIAFLSVECTGFALEAVNGLDMYNSLLVVAEGLLAGGAAYFFSVTIGLLTGSGARQGVLTAQEQASTVVTGAVILMAASGFSFSGISPGRIISAVLILLLARSAKEQGGSIAGIVLGLAMAMSNPDYMYLAAAYAFGGLLAGLFARFGRFASAGAFIVANLIVAMITGTGTLIIVNIYEVVAACILFVVLPTSIDRLINRFFAHARDIPAVEGLRRSVVMRLDYASGAMNEIAQTVDAVSHKLAGLSAPDLGSVYRSVSDEVCRVCGLRMYCWENNFHDTMTAFNDMTPTLREKGQIGRQDVPPQFAKHCSRLDDVVQKVNSGYIEYAVREGAWRRLAEIRSVVTDQFEGMSEMLDELAADFSRAEQVDADAATRVIGVCEDFGLDVLDAVCLIGRSGRMTVEILASDAGAKIQREKWQAAIDDACGREFDHPVVTSLGNTVKIALAEKPQFSVTVGSAQLNCKGERLCGDAFETFTDGQGRWYAVLSDGMGNGGRAAVDGAMASGLTSRMIRAGFGFDSVLRMVNSALMVKSGDESLATLDIAEIDLFSGHLECRKAGASPTLLCSMGRVSRIERTALPVGILRDIKAELSADTLVDGDILVMFSDGALACGMDSVETKLKGFDAKEGSLKRLAEDIAIAARKKQSDHEDDITVLAMKIQKVHR